MTDSVETLKNAQRQQLQDKAKQYPVLQGVIPHAEKINDLLAEISYEERYDMSTLQKWAKRLRQLDDETEAALHRESFSSDDFNIMKHCVYNPHSGIFDRWFTLFEYWNKDTLKMAEELNKEVKAVLDIPPASVRREKNVFFKSLRELRALHERIEMAREVRRIVDIEKSNLSIRGEVRNQDAYWRMDISIGWASGLIEKEVRLNIEKLREDFYKFSEHDRDKKTLWIGVLTALFAGTGLVVSLLDYHSNQNDQNVSVRLGEEDRTFIKSIFGSKPDTKPETLTGASVVPSNGTGADL